MIGRIAGRDDAPAHRQTYARFALLCVILVAAAAFRLYAIRFGLPFLEARPDEETAIGHAAAVLTGELNPHFFDWPSLTFYLFALLFTCGTLVERALFSGRELTVWDQVLMARIFVAIAGTATVWVMYRLGREFADAATGLLAATFLTVAILHVRESHFAMTDTIMTLFVLASLALLLRAINDGRRLPQRFAVAGLMGGLATSTKYSAVAVVAAMAAAQVVLLASAAGRRSDARAWTPPIAFLGALAAAFVVGTPFALIEFPAFLAGLQRDATHLSQGHGVMLGRGWAYHALSTLPYGVGIPIFVVGIVGITVVAGARRLRQPGFVVGSFAAVFYASIGSGYTVFMRYALPLVPVVCLAAAIAVRQAAVLGWSARTRATIMTVIAIAIALPGAFNCTRFDALLARTDTRVLAMSWFADRLTADDTVYEAGNVYTNPDLGFLPGHRWVYDAAARSFGDPLGHLPDWLVIPESPLSTYNIVPAGIRELARDEYVLAHVVRAMSGSPDKMPRGAVYDPQDAFFLPVSGFETILRPGPAILIYRRASFAAR